MGVLVEELGLSEDFGYPESSLKVNANRFLEKHTGYKWDDLVKFAKTKTNTLP